MAFMIPEYERGTFYAVEEVHGGITLVPGDLVGPRPKLADFRDYVETGEPESFEKETGWFVRLSAPGYLDATDWDGPFRTKEEARRHVEDWWEVDPDTGEELDYGNNPRRKKRRKSNPKAKRITPPAKRNPKKAPKKNPGRLRSLNRLTKV